MQVGFLNLWADTVENYISLAKYYQKLMLKRSTRVTSLKSKAKSSVFKIKLEKWELCQDLSSFRENKALSEVWNIAECQYWRGAARMAEESRTAFLLYWTTASILDSGKAEFDHHILLTSWTC